ncbi:uncharacterized protein C16orf46 homolog [Erythrolamprus reginae]|uniref:uncharacterized protein C16orf46 homolog n=1 Tax=Erythrolamprus reginae TaxID=121349 RepID=UPI00396CCB1C
MTVPAGTAPPGSRRKGSRALGWSRWPLSSPHRRCCGCRCARSLLVLLRLLTSRSHLESRPGLGFDLAAPPGFCLPPPPLVLRLSSGRPSDGECGRGRRVRFPRRGNRWSKASRAYLVQWAGKVGGKEARFPFERPSDPIASQGCLAWRDGQKEERDPLYGEDGQVVPTQPSRTVAFLGMLSLKDGDVGNGRKPERGSFLRGRRFKERGKSMSKALKRFEMVIEGYYEAPPLLLSTACSGRPATAGSRATRTEAGAGPGTVIASAAPSPPRPSRHHQASRARPNSSAASSSPPPERRRSSRQGGGTRGVAGGEGKRRSGKEPEDRPDGRRDYGAEGVQPAVTATVMNSSGQNQSEINSDKATTKSRNAESENHCIYANERRERNQIYTLLSISNSVNEQVERPWECANGTGWEEAVKSWSKTAPFAYLQLQKKVRKSKTSESVNRCLYCLDLMPSVEPEPKNIVKVKSDFKLNPTAALGSPPEKQQTLLYSNSVTTTTTATTTSATDEPKKETDFSKLHSIQISQGEKKRMDLREAQASLSEKKLFFLKENLLFPAEKKPVPIKEYNILPLGKAQSLETVKTKEIRSHEPLLWNQSGNEITAKSSLVLPPLKDAALKHSLDNSPKTSKAVNSQAGAKTSHVLAETVSCPQFLKPKHLTGEPRIDAVYDVVKEQIKRHEVAPTFVPRLSKTSLLSRHLDRGCWHGGFLPERKSLTLSGSVQRRRHGHLQSSHSLQAKGTHSGKASEIRSRSYNASKQEGSQAKSLDLPLLSGLFPSLTVSRIALTALPSRLT